VLAVLVFIGLSVGFCLDVPLSDIDCGFLLF